MKIPKFQNVSNDFCLFQYINATITKQKRDLRQYRIYFGNVHYYIIRRILLFYQVLDNFDYFVGISLIELSTGQ